MRLDCEGLDALLNQSSVAAREAGQIRNACDLEPVQVDGIVCDPLRIGLAETHGQVSGEPVPVHGQGTFAAPLVSKQTT